MPAPLQIDHDEVKRLYDAGWSPPKIGKHFNTSAHPIRRILFPEKHAEHMARNRQLNRERARRLKSGDFKESPHLADGRARLAEIPRDTRTHMQRLLGDPIPERSALFQQHRG